MTEKKNYLSQRRKARKGRVEELSLAEAQSSQRKRREKSSLSHKSQNQGSDKRIILLAPEGRHINRRKARKER